MGQISGHELTQGTGTHHDADPAAYIADENKVPECINYKPRGDRVIVRRLPPPAPRPGEVVVPQSQQRKLNEGIVIAIGPGMRNRITGQIDPVDLEVGDHICFLDYAGCEIEVDGVGYISMRDEEIHGQRK